MRPLLALVIKRYCGAVYAAIAVSGVAVYRAGLRRFSGFLCAVVGCSGNWFAAVLRVAAWPTLVRFIVRSLYSAVFATTGILALLCAFDLGS